MTWSSQQSNFPSDHYIMEFQIQQASRRVVTRNIFDYNRRNFDELRSFLTHNPLETFSSDNIDKCWLLWKDWFLKAVNKFVPVKTVKDGVNSPPWIDGEVRHFIRKKYSVRKKYRECRTEYRKQKLREISQTTDAVTSFRSAIALGMTVGQVTGSTKMINVLHGLGHSVSSSTVRTHDSALASVISKSEEVTIPRPKHN